MPENDPIQQLEQFHPGGFAVPPLSPEEVRRRGDRRRRTRRGAAAVGAAAAVAALVVPVVAVTGGGGGPDGRTERFATSAPDPTPAPTKLGGVTTYPGVGIEVASAEDTAQLRGTTAEFRSFIATRAERAVSYGQENCPGAFHGVTVKKYSGQGYAIGGVNDCGGVTALWVKFDGQWQDGDLTQDAWDCDNLEYLGVPTSFAGECFDESGDFGPDTAVGGLVRLGMTSAELTDAGGQDMAPESGAACRGIVFPGRVDRRYLVDGWMSAAGRLVAISARPGMKTPERIGLGSSEKAMRTAYPNGSMSANGYWVVPLSATSQYEFGLGQGGRVVEMLLSDPRQQCYG